MKVVKFLDPEKQRRVNELLRLSKTEPTSPRPPLNNTNVPTPSTNITTDNELIQSERDQQREELDHLIASECILCGEIMIKSIVKPFINPEEIDIIKSWEV